MTPHPAPDAGGEAIRPTRPVAPAIVGPTASGKTALSIEVARRLDGEVVSMDSRQVYRGMDIGTAKVTAAEMGSVPHHGLNLIDPDERYSAGRFGREARGWIDEIRARGHVPILVGGTGFFLRSLAQPLFEEPPLDAGRRRRLEEFLASIPPAERKRWLTRLDPGSAKRLAAGGGAQRVKRALEVALLTGRTLPWWHQHAPAGRPALPLLVFVIELPREELDRRIDRRVDAMLGAGLVDEVRDLISAGYAEDAPAMTATGYRQIIAHLRGEKTLDEAAEEIRHETRRYARRQLTWYRNQLPDEAVRLNGLEPAESLATTIEAEWRAATTN